MSATPYASRTATPRGRARSPRLSRVVLVLTLAVPSALGLPASLQGQSGAEGEEPERHWWTLWSQRSPEDRVIWGMWTTHVNRHNDGWQNDRTAALIYDGYYGGTFRTTHGPRAYTLGVERSWLSGTAGALDGMVGFRMGVVYGYDGRLGWMAERYPILPFAQPVLYAGLGPLAVDLTYTWVVISTTAALRF